MKRESEKYRRKTRGKNQEVKRQRKIKLLEFRKKKENKGDKEQQNENTNKELMGKCDTQHLIGNEHEEGVEETLHIPFVRDILRLQKLHFSVPAKFQLDCAEGDGVRGPLRAFLQVMAHLKEVPGVRPHAGLHDIDILLPFLRVDGRVGSPVEHRVKLS